MKFGSRRGNSMVEFTLVGIPLIFILISVFEVSRGMWIYHTLAYSAKDAARYAAVHGQDCLAASPACAITVATLAAHTRDAGVGLLPSSLNVTYAWGTTVGGVFAPSVSVPCNPLNSCLADATCFPAAANCAKTGLGAMPGAELRVTATYPFRSAISMFWPGGGQGIAFGTFNLPARASERVSF